MVKKVLANCYIYLILLLMYLPILMLIAFSVSTNDVVSFSGDFNFGFDLYKNLFSNTKVAHDIWVAVANTLILAVTSALVSVILGTLGAIGTFYLKRRSKNGLKKNRKDSTECVGAVEGNQAKGATWAMITRCEPVGINGLRRSVYRGTEKKQFNG